MRIGELARRSGVSIPTIKYYLRERLLPPGAATAPNQASYGEEHLHRLRLIRALLDVGGLTVAAAREVLAAVDEPGIGQHELLGVAHRATEQSARREHGDSAAHARAEAESFVRARGWMVQPDAPALDRLAEVIAAWRALGQEDLLACLDGYARAAEVIAQQEVDTVLAQGDRAAMVEAVVIGTVLGEAALIALRRLAQEDASARRAGLAPSGRAG
ncbi:MAG: MerR family transcriptional regulator [Dactylosporangium sp.]|nr:MerR family transcriptional regulator [Dactylosporangium sp.]